VGIDHPSQALLDHLKAFRNQEERSGGCHQQQALQTRGIPQAGCFQAEQPTFVVQEAFFDLKTLTVLRERLHAGGFIADHLPLFQAVCGTAQNNMNRTGPLAGDRDVVKATGLPGDQLDLIYFAQPLLVQNGPPAGA
jgi:hypothetical protein